MNQRKAFTLLELLIVVAIIAVLAGLILVGVTMLREQSRRVACASNLKNWGLCAIAASTDNQGALFGSFFEGQTSAVHPQIVAVTDSYWSRNNIYFNQEYLNHPIMRAQQFTIARMAAYMDGGEQVLEELARALGTTAATLTSFSPASRSIAGGGQFKDLPVAAFSGWRCPSQRAGINLIPANTERAVSYVQGIGYSYFARSDLWKSGYGGGMPAAKAITIHAGVEPTIVDAWVADGPTSCGAPMESNVNGVNMVCGRQAVGERVLMAETLFYDGMDAAPSQTFYGPNHIRTRSTNDARGDITKLSGNNVLMGDGRVVWKSASMMNVAEIATHLSDGRQRHFIGTIE